jgi:3-oxoacyl-[acyl-carrier protein] reductase
VDADGFEGRVAIITGGGRGFGRAFGRALAERGAHVVLVDLDGDVAEEAAAGILAAGGSAQGVACDIADEAEVEAVVADVVEDRGGIDILINNAGLHSLEYGIDWAQLGIAKLRRLFDVNVMGTMICTLLVRPAMAGRPGANILNISSSAAYQSQGAYGVTKLAVRGLTTAWARELGPEGIRVNGIAPGLHLTDTIREEFSPEMIAGHRAHQFLPLEGNEQDIVEAMLYLCSDRARFVTGETIRVTAGYAATT